MPAIRPESIGVSASAVPPASPTPSPPQTSGRFVVSLVGFFERVTGGILAALLALYLNERFRFSVAAASTASGYFHALAYTGCIGGGLLADRWLGYSLAVALG